VVLADLRGHGDSDSLWDPALRAIIPLFMGDEGREGTPKAESECWPSRTELAEGHVRLVDEALSECRLQARVWRSP
jgi:hypothetical protein